MGIYISYKRISTDTEKQNYNRQTKALENYAKQHGIHYSLEYEEEKSAKNFEDREMFKRMEFLIKGLEEPPTVVFKDVSRFSRDAEEGYKKYMEWLECGINIVFIDNPTVSSDYIKQLMNTAEEQDLVTKTAMEMVVKLMLIVELDRAQKQREYISKAITDGIKASSKKSGRKKGQLDKMTPELEKDIKKFLADRSVKQVDLMKKHGISRNTLKTYIERVKEL